MKYALNIDRDGRVLSVTYKEFASEGMPIVDNLPAENMADYRYINNEFIFDPQPKLEFEPTAQDDIDAMLVDHEYRLTMLELGLV